MNLAQLRYALSVRQTGSFSKTAQKEGLTQSAVSQQITKLEISLGFDLFDRQTKPVSTTVSGERFLKKARSILTDFQRLNDFAFRLSEEQRGLLQVGIIPTLSPFLTPLFIHNLQEKYPGIRLVVHELVTKEIINHLLEGELDGGIISTPITTELEFVTERLFYEKFFCYVSHLHPLIKKSGSVAIEDIQPEELWLLQEGNCFSDQINNICQLAHRSVRQAKLAYHTNSIDALRRIVDDSKGVTFLPELATLSIPPSQEEQIKNIKGPVRAREISLIYSKGELKTGLLEKLSDAIQSSLPRSMTRVGKKVLVQTNVVV